jgi:hypothetical protein
MPISFLSVMTGLARPDTPSSAAATASRLAYRTHASIAEIPREDWQRLLPNDPESWDYYRAVERATPPNLRLGAMTARDGEQIVALAPMFRLAYRLDTPFQGGLRKLSDWVHERWPHLVSLPVVGLGSPMSDNCSIGFAPQFNPQHCCEAFDGMLAHLHRDASGDGSLLMTIKSLGAQGDILQEPLERHDYNRVTSVPLVVLDLPFRSLDDYLATLRPKTAAYLRRKYRAAAKIRPEYRASIVGLEQQIYALFQSTLRQSAVDYGEFEQLTPDYFPAVLAGLGDRAQVMLCWHGDDLVSFQLSLIGPDRIVTKHIGMKYPEARNLNLYFVNWLKLIEFAIANRIPTVEMGATTYATKLLFGGQLDRRWLYFRFRRRVSNAVLRPIAPLFDFERHDPELRRLADRV